MTGSLIVFAALALAAIATPGPTVMLAMTNGAERSSGAIASGIAGACVSDVVLLTGAAAGLGILLLQSAMLFSVLKWVGAAYLIYLGARLLQARGGDGAAANDSALSPAAAFSRSLLVSITNPKGYMFVAALLPQFIDPARPLVPQYLQLGGVFVAIDAAVMLAYAAIGLLLAPRLTVARHRMLNRATGAVFIAMAGLLALARPLKS